MNTKEKGGRDEERKTEKGPGETKRRMEYRHTGKKKRERENSMTKVSMVRLMG